RGDPSPANEMARPFSRAVRVRPLEREGYLWTWMFPPFWASTKHGAGLSVGKLWISAIDKRSSERLPFRLRLDRYEGFRERRGAQVDGARRGGRRWPRSLS